MGKPRKIDDKASLAKKGSSAVIITSSIVAFIAIFIWWPISIFIGAFAIYWAVKSSNSIASYSKNQEVYLGDNSGLLALDKLNSSSTPFAVIVDVETTGLLFDKTMPTKKKVNENPSWYPSIVQIAWITINRYYEVVEHHSFLIRQSATIPQRAIDIHGITDEMCRKQGGDLKKILSVFNLSIQECEYLVGHNVMFDKYVIEAECIKLGLPKPFTHKKKYDTMKMGRSIMGRNKSKLEDLAYAVLGEDLLLDNNINFHDANDDVLVTGSIFATLHKNEIKY